MPDRLGDLGAMVAQVPAREDIPALALELARKLPMARITRASP